MTNYDISNVELLSSTAIEIALDFNGSS